MLVHLAKFLNTNQTWKKIFSWGTCNRRLGWKHMQISFHPVRNMATGKMQSSGKSMQKSQKHSNHTENIDELNKLNIISSLKWPARSGNINRSVWSKLRRFLSMNQHNSKKVLIKAQYQFKRYIREIWYVHAQVLNKTNTDGYHLKSFYGNCRLNILSQNRKWPSYEFLS